MKDRLRSSKLGVGMFAAFVAGLAGVGLIQLAMAAGQLKLIPSSSSIQNGKTVNVAVRINPDQPVDGVEATIKYDQSKLQLVSVNPTSVFPIELANSNSAGTVQITRGHLTGTVSGDQVFANITFKALAGNGTTTVEVTGNATASGSYINPGFQNATISLTSPVSTTPPPTGGGSTPPSGGNGGSGGSNPDPAPDGNEDESNSNSGDGNNSGNDGQKNTNTAISNIEQKVREFTRAKFKVTTKQKARVYILFGTDQNQLHATTEPTELSTTHVVTLPNRLLIPGTTFYYKVIAEDESGKKTESAVQNFSTKGYSIRVLVTDKFEKRVRNSKVKLFSEPKEGETDDEGYVTFHDVAPGNHHLEYEQDDTKYSQEVLVSDSRIKDEPDGSQTADMQYLMTTFSDLEFASTKQMPIFPAVIASVLLLALVGGYIIIRRRKSNPYAHVSQPPAPTGSVRQPVEPQATDDLINKAGGIERPNPGTTITPSQNDRGDHHNETRS